jgi:hypothetical protein
VVGSAIPLIKDILRLSGCQVTHWNGRTHAMKEGAS